MAALNVKKKKIKWLKLSFDIIYLISMVCKENNYNVFMSFVFHFLEYITGVDPGFQARGGGGGGALKKIAPSEGMHENFWGISCEKSRFYAKKSYFFQL